MSRVILQSGRRPIIIIAPHGYSGDDLNTDIISEVISTEMNAFAVINKGWRRAEKALPNEGYANLNNINHCELYPCRKEFLNPLLSYKAECIFRYSRAYCIYIHGMANKEDIDLVLGFGQGNPPSYTCSLVNKNSLAIRLQEEGFKVCQAKPNGKFAAWNQDNLTQYWRRPFTLDQRVTGVQIEIAHRLRSDPELATKTALTITRAIDRLFHSRTSIPNNFIVEEC